MTWFLYVIIFLLVMSAFGKLTWLHKGVMPPREPFQEMLDVVINVALAVWAATLL